MDYKEFLNKIMSELEQAKEHLGVERFDLKRTTKNNQKELDGIQIIYEQMANIAPVVYLNEFYDAYQFGEITMEEILRNLQNTIRSLGERMDLPFSVADLTPENAREHLVLQLINKDWNQDKMEQCAYMELQDLIAVPRWNLANLGEDEQASFLVTKDVQNNVLRMTDEEMLSTAFENTMKQNYRIRGMYETMREMMGLEFDQMYEMGEKEELYILTNDQKTFGATGLLSKEILQEASEKLGEERFFVIPSSIHETILVPESMCEDPATLQDMCQTVNAEQVSLEERLGENIYFYNGNKLQICNSREEAIRQRKETEDMEQTITKRRVM